tara:strand:- start:457 stop:1731 length:1275 start_codon:yes stop_codon:yes gene_type:complete
MSDKKVLVIGSGGREYAFAWKLSKDSEVSQVYCAPGNGGTEAFSINLDIDINNHEKVLDKIHELNIDLTVIGPEGPLADGIVDYLEDNNAKVFGPDKFCSQLESSKLFARDVMKEYNIPQPKYVKCSSADEAIAVREEWGLPLVVKADGLAAGKGVIICNNNDSFNDAIEAMFNNPKFGNASKSVSVEECLIGEELSVFAVCDGSDYKILNTAQDHKRAFDNDKGPNTGGMGAYSPTPLSTSEIISKTEEEVIKPTLKAMNDKGHPYKGFLYVGIMIVDGNPFVIEFNVRMGDPETQVVIPLLDSSLYSLLNSCLDEKLSEVDLEISNKTAVTVVLTAKGYPGSYSKGMKIEGLNQIDSDLVFHAGTKMIDNEIVTSGGRVLNVIGFGTDLESAINDAYRISEKITFDDKFLRRDIGQKGLSYK